ncbi:ATP-binding cassette domain-containing protein [Candidatus Uabimicrobium amorphum]|uniref:ABC transporter ATP-binding protein n=1 Tax=Uabimicrobium amorphum TaxID=2596890 RepID=A0A5S9F1D9_UABAM|nr:ATP-binding cassette domain-containing protein [Candidatus Uabimicrobium amorphum]BBM82507.1 ABC transporter ATP-binding protein [Candidatus Uabimicrobium amorphum]
MKTLIETRNACVVTDEKRTIVQELNMCLSQKERVAIIGRNGVGKSTLLNVFSGKKSCESGKVILHTSPYFVEQQFQLSSVNVSDVLQQLQKYPRHLVEKELQALQLRPLAQLVMQTSVSHGEFRKIKLIMAKLQQPQLIILDEPTQDLDTCGIAWLSSWLSKWQGAVIVVSHDQELLCDFNDFFIVAESGCRYFCGSFAQLQEMLEKEYVATQEHYLRNLRNMIKKEQHTHHIARRKARKKRYGRISELDRATPRQTLNQKRDDAQCQHGKAKKIREQRIEALRSWTKDTRRALHVELPLVAPQREIVKSQQKCPVVVLENVGVFFGERRILSPISLSQLWERTAVVGANGSGKTTLLRVMMQEIIPQQGKVATQKERIGYIAQNANNWKTEESLWRKISRYVDSLEIATQILIAHKFPLALAKRPLNSLSPGERIRAALICLFQQPNIELLILDEPNTQLDFLGQKALVRALQEWPGGFVIASHNRSFLKQLAIDRTLQL